MNAHNPIIQDSLRLFAEAVTDSLPVLLNGALPRTELGRHNDILEQARWWSRHVLTLAAGYQVTGDRRCLDRIMVLVGDAESWGPWHWEANLTYDLTTGEMAATLAWLLFWLRPSLSEQSVQQIVGLGRRRCIEPFLNEIDRPDPVWWSKCENNWGAVCYGGAYALALAAPEIPHAARAAELGDAGISRYLQNGLAADGSSCESIGYWQYGIVYLAHAVLAHAAAGRGRHSALDSVAVRQGFDFPLDFTPGEAHIGFGDSNRFVPSGMVVVLAQHAGRNDIASECIRRIENVTRSKRWADLDPYLEYHPDEAFLVMLAKPIAAASRTTPEFRHWTGNGWGIFNVGRLALSLRGGSTLVPHGLRELAAIALAVDGVELLENIENWPYPCGWFISHKDGNRGDSRSLYWEEGSGSKNVMQVNGCGQIIRCPGVCTVGQAAMTVDATASYSWMVTRAVRTVAIAGAGLRMDDEMAVTMPSCLELRFLSRGRFIAEGPLRWRVERNGRSVILEFSADVPLIARAVNFERSIGTIPAVPGLRIMTQFPVRACAMTTTISA